MRLVVGDGMRLTLLGIAVGLALSLMVTRVLQGVLFGVEPDDPLTFIGLASVLLSVATFAAWWSGRRAARLDPLVLLRDA